MIDFIVNFGIILTIIMTVIMVGGFIIGDK